MTSQQSEMAYLASSAILPPRVVNPALTKLIVTPSQLSQNFANTISAGPKPDTTQIGQNVLLNGTPSPKDVPLPAGNSGVALPAGVLKTDLPPTSVLPAGANLNQPNLTPLTNLNVTPLTMPASLSNTPSMSSSLFGVPMEYIIGAVVLILLVVAYKYRK